MLLWVWQADAKEKKNGSIGPIVSNVVETYSFVES